MSYTPTVWKKGDIITSEKLNKLENGVAGSGGGVLIVHGTVDDEDMLTLDKTWQEIYDAFSTSSVLLRIELDDEFSLAVVLEVSFLQDQGEDVYQVTTLNLSFECSSASEYPKSSVGR